MKTIRTNLPFIISQTMIVSRFSPWVIVPQRTPDIRDRSKNNTRARIYTDSTAVTKAHNQSRSADNNWAGLRAAFCIAIGRAVYAIQQEHVTVAEKNIYERGFDPSDSHAESAVIFFCNRLTNLRLALCYGSVIS